MHPQTPKQSKNSINFTITLLICFSECDGAFPSSSSPLSEHSKQALILCHTLAQPDFPQDGQTIFEVLRLKVRFFSSPRSIQVIVFCYSMVAMLMQMLHLYRTVFWLPHSYNTSAVVSSTSSLL